MSTPPRENGSVKTRAFTDRGGEVFPENRHALSQPLPPEEVRSRDVWSCFKEPLGASRSSGARLLWVVEGGEEEEADPDLRRLLWP